VGVREGLAYSRNKLALRSRIRNLNLKSQFSIFDIFRYIRVHVTIFVGGLWALNWAWDAAGTNLRCVRSLGICMPNLNSLALIVSGISAFIRTDRQTDRRTWLDLDLYQEYTVDRRFYYLFVPKGTQHDHTQQIKQ